MAETDTPDPKSQLLDAALPHVAFDGWTEATFRAAVAESGVEPGLARALCPRGAVDLALAFHARGDAKMAELYAAENPAAMRYSQKVALAVRLRLEGAGDREAVRRGVTLFALPQHAALGARAIWGTADAIWELLGDTSDDANWYTKRATLSGVYSATLLYWLGDESAGHAETWAFLDRRIDEVMQVEKAKAAVRKNPLCKLVMAGPDWLASKVRAPLRPPRTDLPGLGAGKAG